MDRPPDVVDLLPRCTFPPAGSPVVCALSGGPDSAALLVLAAAAGCDVTAVHVDHGLRAGSAAEAAAAAGLAAELGVPCRVERITLADGPNLEARARAARRHALPPDALTGHTADDRAATLLVNLLRGAGGAGLAAMGPAPTRPILALRRSETLGLCRTRGLQPVHDPTNADPRFVRNRVRDELLPLMADIAGRDVVPLLVRTAALLADDVALADAQSSGLDATDARALAAMAPPLARRVVRRWLTGVVGGGSGYPPDAATVERVLQVAAGEHRACEITGGQRVERHRQRLRIVGSGALVSPDGMTSGIAAVEHGEQGSLDGGTA
ncbi:MAG TPA: tRNA lysidine(34) synthetase TilS [Ilumatobacteraceae bacterium]|nr:tRNA lysidine(34) synthetase TilS [Ilumatobacteraceae bacterium]